MSFDKTKISIKEAKKILKSTYNLEGEITSLNGEIDFNFKIISNKSIFKNNSEFLAGRYHSLKMAEPFVLNQCILQCVVKKQM